MAPPSEIKAIVIEKNTVATIQTVAPPKLRDDYLLVRTKAVGLNPTDWKHIHFFGDVSAGARVGCDYVGIVEEVGSKVTKSFAKGDRVCGMAHGSNQSQLEDGSFAEYIVVKGDVTIKVPDHLSDEEAATLGVGIQTVGQGLFQALELPMLDAPAKEPFPILIYGGSTATGILGIQFAKLAGAKVATTCSPRNFELVKSLGADAVFDYNSPTVVQDIKAWDSNIQRVWDCIATTDSVEIAVGAMADAGGRYRSLLPLDEKLIKDINPKVESNSTLAYTGFGEAFDKFGSHFDASQEDFAAAQKIWETARQLLAEKKLRTARPEVNLGGKGLEGVLHGLEELRQDKVSGRKLVYTL